MPKATKLEQATRIETVRQLILSGNEPGRIVPLVAEKWHLHERQARNYIALARAEIETLAPQEMEYRKAEHIAIRRDIRRRAREAHDLRAELAAAQDEAKLFGLYPAEKREISGPDGGPLVVKAFDYGTAVTPLASRPDRYSLAPGEDQGYFDGATLGQNDDGG